MSAALELGVERILKDSAFRRDAITRTKRTISNDLDPQLYLIVAKNGAPAAVEIQNGFFKGAISLSSRELVEIYGTSRARHATEAPQTQRIGLLYLASPSTRTGHQLNSIASQRPTSLAFTILHAVPGGKLAAPGQQFAVQWTEAYNGVEISATTRVGSTILMSCTYTQITTSYTSTDPNLAGKFTSFVDHKNSQYS